MKPIFAVGLLFVFGTCFGQDSGLYSKTATSTWARSGAFTIASPDKEKEITVKPIEHPQGDATDVVTVRAYGHEYKTPIGEWVNAEVAWAPDSKAFFVTYSDGGNVGTYHLKVFYVEPKGLRVVEPFPSGRVFFKPTCFDPEEPNVGAIKWGADSSRIVIAVEVPPHSSCASMGTFRAFEISLKDGKILQHYDQLQAKQLFADSIGKELRNANDDCIRQPERCVPPGLTAHAREASR
ncbi:MAG: hypothetical protein ACLPHP_11885 [Candidatus Sulfotelmatobacter sp.]